MTELETKTDEIHDLEDADNESRLHKNEVE